MSQVEVIRVLKRFKRLGLAGIAKEAGINMASASTNLKSLIKQGIVKRDLEIVNESFKERNKISKRNRFRYIYYLI